MKTPAPQTIDVLILQTLAAGEPMSARALSKMWGEDRVRVQGWLEKFNRMGLCRVWVSASDHRKFGFEMSYLGWPGAIERHLSNGNAGKTRE